MIFNSIFVLGLVQSSILHILTRLTRPETTESEQPRLEPRFRPQQSGRPRRDGRGRSEVVKLSGPPSRESVLVLQHQGCWKLKSSFTLSTCVL